MNYRRPVAFKYKRTDHPGEHIDEHQSPLEPKHKKIHGLIDDPVVDNLPPGEHLLSSTIPPAHYLPPKKDYIVKTENKGLVDHYLPPDIKSTGHALPEKTIPIKTKKKKHPTHIPESYLPPTLDGSYTTPYNQVTISPIVKEKIPHKKIPIDITNVYSIPKHSLPVTSTPSIFYTPTVKTYLPPHMKYITPHRPKLSKGPVLSYVTPLHPHALPGTLSYYPHNHNGKTPSVPGWLMSLHKEKHINPTPPPGYHTREDHVVSPSIKPNKHPVSYVTPSAKFEAPIKEYLPPPIKSLSAKIQPPLSGYIPPKKPVITHKPPIVSYIPPKKDILITTIKPTLGSYLPPHKGYVPPKKDINISSTHKPPLVSYIPPHKEYVPPKKDIKVGSTYKPPLVTYGLPHKDYIPPKKDVHLSTTSKPLISSYKPPLTDYLPPKKPHLVTPIAHIPPKVLHTGLTYKPPKTIYEPPHKEYLPPKKKSHITTTYKPPIVSYVPPHNEYLPPKKLPSISTLKPPLDSYEPPVKDYIPPKLPDIKPSVHKYSGPDLASLKGYLPPPPPSLHIPIDLTYLPPGKTGTIPHLGKAITTTYIPPHASHPPKENISHKPSYVTILTPTPKLTTPVPISYVTPLGPKPVYAPPISPHPHYQHHGKIAGTYIPPKTDYIPPSLKPKIEHIPSKLYVTPHPPHKNHPKPHITLSPLVKSPHHKISDDYHAPPKTHHAPVNDYLPPIKDLHPPKTEYLPPPKVHHAPVKNYLPPIKNLHPPKAGYLPPKHELKKPKYNTTLKPSDYRHTIKTSIVETPKPGYLPPKHDHKLGNYKVTTYKPTINAKLKKLQEFSFPDAHIGALKDKLPGYKPPLYSPTPNSVPYNQITTISPTLPPALSHPPHLSGPLSTPDYYYYYYSDDYYYDDDYYYYYYDYYDDYPSHPAVPHKHKQTFNKQSVQHLLPVHYNINEEFLHDYGYIAGIPGKYIVLSCAN